MKRPLLFALLLTLALPVLAQEAGWPTPAADWWEIVHADQQATYKITDGALELHRVIKVEKSEAGVITLSVTLRLGKKRFPKQTRTFDARAETFSAPLAGAGIQRLREESLDLAGRTWACVVYEFERGEETITAWHCAELSPVFAGGNVKLERRQGDSVCVVELEAYEGP